MYSQYPGVLDQLLDYVLSRYASSGVSYVEFSVGVNDVLRPQIWRHLANPHGLSTQAASVTVRYLAGFSRSQCTEMLNTCLPAERLFEKAVAVSNSRSPEYFTEHLGQLARLSAAMMLARAGGSPRGIHGLVVGLDYFSDEYEHPFCPYSLPEFLLFLESERHLRNGQFGFRYHCGECDESPLVPSAYMIAHMGASCKVILDVYDHFKDLPRPPNAAPLLRIGHGLGFRHFMDMINTPHTGGGGNRETLNGWISSALQLMRRERIPIEVNLTSNDILEPDHCQALDSFLTKNLAVLLCTDNDGIWRCERKRYRSVAAELYAAITGELSRLPGIDHNRLKLLINTGQKAIFSQGQPIADGPPFGKFTLIASLRQGSRLAAETDFGNLMLADLYNIHHLTHNLTFASVRPEKPQRGNFAIEFNPQHVSVRAKLDIAALVVTGILTTTPLFTRDVWLLAFREGAAPAATAASTGVASAAMQAFIVVDAVSRDALDRGMLNK